VKRGDVVVMVAPGDIGKPRPAIIVQADELGPDVMSFLLCPMSSEIQELNYARPVFEPSEENGLRSRSQVMVDKMIALQRERIHRTIGHISQREREQLDRALLVVLGLAR
jgi:mRNA interferase MazF